MDHGFDLRETLAGIPHDLRAYGAWWSTDAGRALMAFADRLAPAIARGARVRTGRGVDPAVVLGILVEALAPPSQLVRALLAPTTEDPVAYLCRSVGNALARELGPESTIDLTSARAAAALPAADPAPDREIPLADAVRAVVRELEPRTPTRLLATLQRLVEHVVDEAADGAMSRLHTRVAADLALHALGWSPDHLRALVNVVAGARPDHARASLVAGFLGDADWRPRESPVHRAALQAYERRMARAEGRTARSPRRSGQAG